MRLHGERISRTGEKPLSPKERGDKAISFMERFKTLFPEEFGLDLNQQVNSFDREILQYGVKYQTYLDRGGNIVERFQIINKETRTIFGVGLRHFCQDYPIYYPAGRIRFFKGEKHNDSNLAVSLGEGEFVAFERVFSSVRSSLPKTG